MGRSLRIHQRPGRPVREDKIDSFFWRMRQAMQIMGNLLIGGLALCAIPACWDYVYFMKREGTPVLGLPFMWVFLPFVFLLVALVCRSALAIWRASKGQGLEAELRL